VPAHTRAFGPICWEPLTDTGRATLTFADQSIHSLSAFVGVRQCASAFSYSLDQRLASLITRPFSALPQRAILKVYVNFAFVAWIVLVLLKSILNRVPGAVRVGFGALP
jgi:hypothetical protein